MNFLFRQGGQVVNDVWTGSAGGRFSDKLYIGAANESGVDFIELPEV